MPIPSTRILSTDRTEIFGGRGDENDLLQDLTEIQTKSYHRFLQEEVESDSRKPLGLEGILQEVFFCRIMFHREYPRHCPLLQTEVLNCV